MISELLIALLVIILGVYWFRYNCRCILRAEPSRERLEQVASANQLSFNGVEVALNGEPSLSSLDALNGSMLRDYEVLTCLLRYTAPLSGNGYTVEQRLLMVDFRLMQCCFAMTRGHITGPARRSLREQARILGHFANTLGERSATAIRA